MKVSRRLLIIVAVIVVLDILAQAWGAAYKGVVLDAETGKPI